MSTYRRWPPFSLVDEIMSRTVVVPSINEEDRASATLGQVISAWSNLERTLRKSLIILLDDNEEAGHAIYFTLNAIKNRIDLIESVAKYVIPDCNEKDGFLSLLGKVRRLSKTRNHYIHGRILQRDPHYLLELHERRGEALWKTTKISFSDMEGHLAAVRRADFQLRMAITDQPAHYVWRGTFPDRHRRQRLLQSYLSDSQYQLAIKPDDLPPPSQG